jgi:hypothetical protein
MSDLRKQLQYAKDEYRSLRYPGDLTNEMLQPKTRRRLWPLAVAAAAALLVIAIRVEHSPQQKPRELAVITPTTQSSVVADYSISPQPPADMSLAPPACEFDFTPPSFSLSADKAPTTSTTQESV